MSDLVKSFHSFTVAEMEVPSRHGKHKMIRCKVCAKSIRSDNLRRHYRTHNDFMSMSTAEAHDEVRARHQAALAREEKRQEVEQFAIKEGIPLEFCVNDYDVQSPLLSDKDLERSVLQQTITYRETVDLGRRLTVILDKGIALEEALSREFKDALDLYRKQRP